MWRPFFMVYLSTCGLTLMHSAALALSQATSISAKGKRPPVSFANSGALQKKTGGPTNLCSVNTGPGGQ